MEELYGEKKSGKCVYDKEMATGSDTEKPVATTHKGPSSPRSLSWRVSKIMTKMLRHRGCHRGDDGATDWNTLLPMLCRDFENENAGRWSTKEWLDLLQQGSDKKRFSLA